MAQVPCGFSNQGVASTSPLLRRGWLVTGPDSLILQNEAERPRCELVLSHERPHSLRLPLERSCRHARRPGLAPRGGAMWGGPVNSQHQGCPLRLVN